MIVAVVSFLLNTPFSRTGSHVYARNLLKRCLRASKNSADEFEFHAFAGKADDWDMVEIYGPDPERVGGTYPGYESHLYNTVPPDLTVSVDLSNRRGVRKSFVLHHGLVQLRKNVHHLIHAFEGVRSGCSNFDWYPVLSGELWKNPL